MRSSFLALVGIAAALVAIVFAGSGYFTASSYDARITNSGTDVQPLSENVQPASDDLRPVRNDVQFANYNLQPVNRVVGDAGYIARFGERPDAAADEDVRIASHLAYVENLLRERPADHLTPEQQRRRAGALDHLRAYRSAGVFPRNTESSDTRTPVFIDADGRICAVGYLVEQTAGRRAAEQINERYQFAHVDEMELPWLHEWAQMHGFAVRELAMIQPAYEWHPPVEETEDDMIDRTLEVGSITLNVASVALNGWMISRHRGSVVAASAGLMAGGAGMAIGLSDRAHYTTPDLVAAGASVLISGWNLLRLANPPPRRVDASAAAYRPDVSPVLLPSADGSKLGVQARWKF
jgi:hypothetical protein